MCNKKNLSKCFAKSIFPARMFDQKKIAMLRSLYY